MEESSIGTKLFKDEPPILVWLKFMSKKAVAVVGGVAGLVGLGWLITRAKAKQAVPVTVMSNPIRTILLIDGQEVETPAHISLTLGQHRFAAAPKSPNLVVLYGFDRWTVNGKTVSYGTTATINITAPATVTAQYMIAQSGRYPEIAIA
jgi:hypothetical protein